MKPKVYVETSLISYLVGQSSRNLIVAAQQQITNEWWEYRRSGFDLQAIYNDLKEQEKKSGRKVISLPIQKRDFEEVNP
ncbi:MAG: hypothetical protein ACE5HO_08230 [bacterium]